jgi:hypothetical protein
VELSDEGKTEDSTILLYHGMPVKAPVCNALEIFVPKATSPHLISAK